MDGEFACPECGQTVQVRGTSPGRQVRCSFCGRLIEVPFLPRVDGEWKRARFTRPRWVPWAWAALAIVLMGIIGTAGVQVLIRGERAAKVRAVERLIESSKSHEDDGRLDLALVDLDSALEVAPSTGTPLADPEALRLHRGDLARRDLQDVVRKLAEAPGSSKPVGAWLNVVARVGADRDLTPLRREIEARFLEVLRAWIDETERQALHETVPDVAFRSCVEGGDLAIHLPQPDQNAARNRFQAIASSLVERFGVVVEAEPGEFVLGTPAGYEKAFEPPAVEALREKGYLPPPKSTRWRELWSRAPYRFSYRILERFEAAYLSTQNRTSRIEAKLSLHERGREIWTTAPNAHTRVPVPNMASYLAGRLALSQNRGDEAEKVLYDDAFSQIFQRFQHGLLILPACRARDANEASGAS